MLRIGKLTDYAVLILAHMARTPESVMSATFLAEALHLSVPTMSKILKILSDAGLVSSLRGSEGGYRLQKPAGEISVAEVIAAMEGEIAMTECCERINHCAINSTCVMKENWVKINMMVNSLLSRLSILDMLEPISIKSKMYG